MVGHRPLDQDEIQSMMESGGFKPATLRKRQKVGEAFSKYNSENYGLDSIKTLLEGDKAQIETSVTEFMGTLTVKKRRENGSMEELQPKKTTFDFWQTNLKTILFMESEGNVDISSLAQFPKL